MTQIKGVYEFVLSFLGDSQRKSERFEHKEASSQGSLGENERLKKRMNMKKKWRLLREMGCPKFHGARKEKYYALCPTLEKLTKNMIGGFKWNFNFC